MLTKWRLQPNIALQPYVCLQIHMQCSGVRNIRSIMLLKIRGRNFRLRLELRCSLLNRQNVSNLNSSELCTKTAASRRLNWRPRRFKWICPFRRKTKYGFCACAITFQTQSNTCSRSVLEVTCVLHFSLQISVLTLRFDKHLATYAWY
jgi:hypothetical protein